MTTPDDRPGSNGGGEPEGEMGEESNGTHEYFVLNLTTKPLDGEVLCDNTVQRVPIPVRGLQPGAVSERREFYPVSEHLNYWKHDGQHGGWYGYPHDLHDGDRYTVVTISDYGIAVVPTATAPAYWDW